MCALLLCAEVYLLLYDFEGSLDRRGGIVAVAVLKNVENDIRVRQRGVIAWGSAGADESIHDQDSLLTLPNSTATLAFSEGGGLSIGADSLVTIEKQGRKTDEIVVHLAQGTLHKDARSSMRKIAVKAGSTVLREKEDGSAFDIRKTSRGFSVVVKKGALVSDRGEKIRAGENAIIQNERIERVASKALKIRLAQPEKDVFYASEPRTSIEWKWEAADQAEFAGFKDKEAPEFSIELSREGEGSPFLKERVELFRFSANLEAGKGYSLKIWASDGARYTSNTIEKRFSVARALPAENLEALDALENKDELFVDRPIWLRWKNPEPQSGSKTASEISSAAEFSLDKDFKEPWIPSKTQAKRLSKSKSKEKIVFLEPREIYWRVKTVYGAEEGHAPRSEIKKLIVLPRPKLKAPSLKSPKIRVRYRKGGAESSRDDARPFLWSAARKTPSSAEVAVDLEWEAVPGAAAYRVQISREEGFKSVLIDQRIGSTRFVLQTTQTERAQKYYFRVAAIDEKGGAGDYSSAREIEIEARKEEDEPDLSRPARMRASLGAGAAYHARAFKSSANPESAAGSGLIPAFGELRLRRRAGERSDWVANLSLLAEKGEIETTNALEDPVGLPLARIEIGQERDLSLDWAWKAGLYGSNAFDLKWEQRKLAAQQKTLLGVFLGCSTSQKSRKRLLLSGTVAPFALGSFGADYSGRAALRLGSLRLPSTRASYFFAELEVFGRASAMEVSYGSAVKLGYFH